MPNGRRGNRSLSSGSTVGLDSIDGFGSPTFPCVLCGRRYSIADIASYVFDSTSMVCGDCLDKAHQDQTTCFGKRYDSNVSACKLFCPDRIMCARYSKDRITNLRELTEEGRRAAIEMLVKPKVHKRPPTHPFPIRNSLVRICWELCLEGTTLYRLERECRRVAGDYTGILRKLRAEKNGPLAWQWQEKAGDVKIEWSV